MSLVPLLEGSSSASQSIKMAVDIIILLISRVNFILRSQDYASSNMANFGTKIKFGILAEKCSFSFFNNGKNKCIESSKKKGINDQIFTQLTFDGKRKHFQKRSSSDHHTMRNLAERTMFFFAKGIQVM